MAKGKKNELLARIQLVGFFSHILVNEEAVSSIETASRPQVWDRPRFAFVDPRGKCRDLFKIGFCSNFCLQLCGSLPPRVGTVKVNSNRMMSGEL